MAVAALLERPTPVFPEAVPPPELHLAPMSLPAERFPRSDSEEGGGSGARAPERGEVDAEADEADDVQEDQELDAAQAAESEVDLEDEAETITEGLADEAPD